MKCEHCGGDMVWKGGMASGHLFCENCDGLLAPPTYHESDQYVVAPKESITIVVVGGGGGGGSGGGKGVITAGSGGSGGSASTGVANPVPTKCPGCWNYVDECTCGVELKPQPDICHKNCTACGGDEFCVCWSN